MAACIAAKHAKWDERPLLIVVKKPGAELTRDALLANALGMPLVDVSCRQQDGDERTQQQKRA